MAFPCSSAARWLAGVVVLLFTSAGWAEAPKAAAKKAATMEKLWVYVGTYTGGSSKGIYRFELDLASGKLTARALAGETANPSFLAIHPSHRFLYAVGELGDFKGKKTGAVTAFAI